MSEPVKKFGINAILMLIVGGFVLPVVVYVANQAAHVPELKVEIRHLSGSIDKLVNGLEAFTVNNDASHQALVEKLMDNSDELKDMRHDCGDQAAAIEKLQNGH